LPARDRRTDHGQLRPAAPQLSERLFGRQLVSAWRSWKPVAWSNAHSARLYLW
jgi:hypothetical protein